jgi:nucleoside-diphosphate-sugar epimerase
MAEKFLVTGGGGFLGQALCNSLRARGDEVYALCRGSYPELEANGVKIIRHDIQNPLPQSLADMKFEGVFHVASKVEMWGPYESFFKTNVLGTRNVIEFCKNAGISRLVYTSSPSVIADDSDTAGIDESYPYPKAHLAPYPATKALAEQEVLGAYSDKLFTIALRPHLIWGPGDRHLVPTVVSRAKAGRLVQVGDGKNLVDTSFIEDCVSAHLKAMTALLVNPRCRGRAYFISQGEPVSLWGWINRILELNRMPKVSRRISYSFARFLGLLCEIGVRIMPGNKEPFLTRFLASQMSRDHYFNIKAARRDLGYEPKYSIEAALQKTFGYSLDSAEPVGLIH